MLYKLANLLDIENTVIGFKCFDLDNLSVVDLTVDEYNSIEECNKFNKIQDKEMLVYRDSKWGLSADKTLDKQYFYIGSFDLPIGVCLHIFIEVSTEKTILTVSLLADLYFDIISCETFRAFDNAPMCTLLSFKCQSITYYKIPYSFEYHDDISIYKETGNIATLGDYFYYYTIESDINSFITIPSNCRYLILNFVYFNIHSLKVVLPKDLQYIKFYNYSVVAVYLDISITFYISKNSVYLEDLRSEIDGVFSSRVNIELY